MSRNLSTTQKPVRKAVSPLLGKLMAAEAELNPLLLKPYVALDALYRGKGSSGVVTMLGQHLILKTAVTQLQSQRLESVAVV